MLNKPFKEVLSNYSMLIQKHMDDLLSQDFSDSKLTKAMRYCALSKGKRIRPFLVIASAQIFGLEPSDALNAAVAIEFIHVYSLIHDDLPAMDNDDVRRNLPACHRKFDEATAILAGDALLTYAFEILASPSTHTSAALRCELIKIIAKAAGFKGMAGGQMIDLEQSRQKISNEELVKLHRLKTGELFMASAEAGAVLGCATIKERQALRYFAHDLGLAFQIKDDILDYGGIIFDRPEIGKIIHKKPGENASIIDVIGMENAKKQLHLLKDQALAHLKVFGVRAKMFGELADFIITRES
jgi:farnesyl diphosphate synthase